MASARRANTIASLAVPPAFVPLQTPASASPAMKANRAARSSDSFAGADEELCFHGCRAKSAGHQIFDELGAAHLPGTDLASEKLASGRQCRRPGPCAVRSPFWTSSVQRVSTRSPKRAISGEEGTGP